MAVIFYCVCGEGMGHAIRSRAIIEHLSTKHDIAIFSFERAFRYLRDVFSDRKNIIEVTEIPGVNYSYENNEFKIAKSIIRNLKKQSFDFFYGNFQLFSDKLKELDPALVISDGEPFFARAAFVRRIPLITIDNVNFFYKCRAMKRYPLHEAIMKFYFRPDFAFNVTVFNLKMKERYRKNNILIGPILRQEIVKARVVHGPNILVYQTSKSNERLAGILKKRKEQYIIYGFDREHVDGNLSFRKFSEKEFVEDLSSCLAVILNGGFTLLSEAIYLKKPVYSIPVRKQIEQEMNAQLLKRAGYGHTSEEINLVDLNYFLDHIGDYRKKLEKKEMRINEFELIEKRVDAFAKNA